MKRAFLLVMDSFGIGGAEDAAAFGDAGADTLGHIAAACAAGAGDRDGLRSGPLKLPNLTRLGLGAAAKASTGALPPGLKAAPGRGGDLRLRRRDIDRQGHAVRPLGDRRRAGLLRLDLFPGDRADLSRRR